MYRPMGTCRLNLYPRHRRSRSQDQRRRSTKVWACRMSRAWQRMTVIEENATSEYGVYALESGGPLIRLRHLLPAWRGEGRQRRGSVCGWLEVIAPSIE